MQGHGPAVHAMHRYLRLPFTSAALGLREREIAVAGKSMAVADPVRQMKFALRRSQPFCMICPVPMQAKVSEHGLKSASSKSKQLSG